MKNINLHEKVSFEGLVQVRAFTPGLVPSLMAKGMPLRDAMAEAERLGGLQYVHKTHNLVTTAGRHFMAKRLSGEETAGITYMAIGTGTAAPVISDTQLGSESLRKPLTECYQGDVFMYSSIFLIASECSFFIKEGGLFGGSLATATANSGSLFCRFLIGEENTVNQFDLSIQHTTEVKA
jgi:hypothetical protein